MLPLPPQIGYDGDREKERWNREETHGTKNKKSLSRGIHPVDLGEGRAVEEHGHERRRHREHGHEPSQQPARR